MACVVAEDLCFEFPIYGSQGLSLKRTFLRAATGGLIAKDASHRIVVRALDGVTFTLGDGDRIGLVGHNGSGKSTLLRVLSGIYEPLRGSVLTRGRVVSMLDVYQGLDYEATGYENIFVRAAIMGYRPKQIKPIIDEIVEFSGLGDYIRMPMRTYSSGMIVRLAFAIATCVTADILLMDEWLSVGDEAFRTKAEQRIQRLFDTVKILVLASHDLSLIRSTCNKVIYLSHGKVTAIEDL